MAFPRWILVATLAGTLVEAGNGVVHVVDAVLLPSAG